MAAKKRQALGSGLDVLFRSDEENEITDLGSENTLTLPIEKIEPRSEQPRKTFDEDLLQDLAESIKQYGLIQPISVRSVGNGYYQIIAGERRWRAAKLANLTEVPVRILDVDDKTTAEIALVENLQREDLNPIEEAKGYKTLMEDFGLTQEETAKSVGKSRPAIANSLRLLTLCPEVLSLIENGKLSAGHAKALVSIESPSLQLKAAETAINKNLSVRKTESLASDIIKKDSENKDTSDNKKDNPYAPNYSEEVSLELSKILNRRVHLISGRKGGKLEIEFYGEDDREELITLIRNLNK